MVPDPDRPRRPSGTRTTWNTALPGKEDRPATGRQRSTQLMACSALRRSLRTSSPGLSGTSRLWALGLPRGSTPGGPAGPERARRVTDDAVPGPLLPWPPPSGEHDATYLHLPEMRPTRSGRDPPGPVAVAGPLHDRRGRLGDRAPPARIGVGTTRRAAKSSREKGAQRLRSARAESGEAADISPHVALAGHHGHDRRAVARSECSAHPSGPGLRASRSGSGSRERLRQSPAHIVVVMEHGHPDAVVSRPLGDFDRKAP